MNPAFLARVTVGTLLAALAVAFGLGLALNGVHRTEVERSATAAAIGETTMLLTPALAKLRDANDIATADRAALNAAVRRVQALPYVDRADVLTTSGRSILATAEAPDADAAHVVAEGNMHSRLIRGNGGWVRVVEVPFAGTSGRYVGVLRIDLDEAQIAAEARSQNGFVFAATLGAMAVLIAAFVMLGAFTLPRIVRQQRELERSARTDALTGLVNRKTFRHDVDAFLQRTPAATGPGSVFLIDLDRFKEVNDTLGHQAGDAVLLLTAQRLVNAVRPDDVVARLGGDEFAVFAPGMNSEAATQLADRIGLNLRKPFDVHGRMLTQSASIGVATFPFDASTFDELLARADQAMYAAKEAGRDRHSAYAPVIGDQRSRRQELVVALRASLEHGEMAVWYQPEVDMATRRPFGLEALLRWNHPARGVTSPDDFLDVARECGFLGELMPWTVRTVCRDIRRLAAAGQIMRVFVNVGPDELMDDALEPTIREALNEYGVPAILFGLELTERHAVHDLDSLARRMQAVRDLGIALALDDFGAGQSSFTRFRALPFDLLKIDQSYVQAAGASEMNRAVLTASCHLAREANVPVVVEGVEDDDEHALAMSIGFTRAQGYLYARPMPIGELESYFARVTTLVAR